MRQVGTGREAILARVATGMCNLDLVWPGKFGGRVEGSVAGLRGPRRTLERVLAGIDVVLGRWPGY